MNFGNLGVALGAGVQEWKAQQKADQEQQLFNQQKEQFDWQRRAEAEKERIRVAEQALSEKYRPMFAAAAKGDYSFVPEYLKSGYNTNTGAWNDGHTAAFQSGPNGSTVHVIDGNGQVVASHDLNPQSSRALLEQAYMMERAGIGAPQFGEYVKHGLESRKVGAEETKAGAARQQALTMESYRNFQQNAPHFMQDGTGRILAMAPDGRSVLGTYGSARPVLGAGGSGSGGDAFGFGKGLPVQVFDTDTASYKQVSGTPVLNKKTGKYDVYIPGRDTPLTEDEAMNGLTVGDGGRSPFLAQIQQLQRRIGIAEQGLKTGNTDGTALQGMDTSLQEMQNKHRMFVTNQKMPVEQAVAELSPIIKKGSISIGGQSVPVTADLLRSMGYRDDAISQFPVGKNGKLSLQAPAADAPRGLSLGGGSGAGRVVQTRAGSYFELNYNPRAGQHGGRISIEEARQLGYIK